MSNRNTILPIALCVLLSMPTHAQSVPDSRAAKPVVAEGVVPDQATKALILDKLRAVYGPERVVDNIQVQAIAMPPNWGRYVAGMLTPALQQVQDGKLEVSGQSVRVTGQVVNEAQRQQVASGLSTASNSSYTVTNSLRTGASGQGLLDATLANRIIEFESGSAQLTANGKAILDEMASKMKELGNARVQIVGHTDGVGARAANVTLSSARAESVKSYLMQQGIDGGSLSVVGRGPDEPVASNETAEGRARNRRIQFRVLTLSQ